MAKVKLCSSKGNNLLLKKGIDALRRNKMMYVQILGDLVGKFIMYVLDGLGS